jgi:hypothetical protein
VSDWGPGGKAGQQQQQQGAGREELRALKDGLKLMAAEVALAEGVGGGTEEANKQLRNLLVR